VLLLHVPLCSLHSGDMRENSENKLHVDNWRAFRSVRCLNFALVCETDPPLYSIYHHIMYTYYARINYPMFLFRGKMLLFIPCILILYGVME